MKENEREKDEGMESWQERDTRVERMKKRAAEKKKKRKEIAI